MDAESRAALQQVLAEQTNAALGTLRGKRGDVQPHVSMVPVAWLPNGDAVIHVSALSPHTRDMDEHPRVSLMLTALLAPGANPQALPRVTLQALASPIAPGDADFEAAAAAYLKRYPGAEQTFALADFSLVRLRADAVRLVAGFGRAYSLKPEEMAALLPR